MGFQHKKLMLQQKFIKISEYYTVVGYSKIEVKNFDYKSKAAVTSQKKSMWFDFIAN